MYVASYWSFLPDLEYNREILGFSSAASEEFEKGNVNKAWGNLYLFIPSSYTTWSGERIWFLEINWGNTELVACADW